MLIIADKNKYVMLFNNRDTLKLVKNEAVEVTDADGEFLIKQYPDIKLYTEKTEKKGKKTNIDNSTDTTDITDTTNTDNLANETNTDNK